MKDTLNSDGNMFGRLAALVLLVGTALAVHRFASGGSCPFSFSCCRPAVQQVSAPPVALEPVAALTPVVHKARALKPVEKPLPLETALPPQPAPSPAAD